jgi:hypothetical protein
MPLNGFVQFERPGWKSPSGRSRFDDVRNPRFAGAVAPAPVQFVLSNVPYMFPEM